MLRKSVTIAVLALLGGCAEFDSIYRNTPVPDKSKPTAAEARVISVDAKQRHLLINPEFASATSTDAVRWRMCAEAAPDVFSAYAASLGVKGSKTGGELSFGSAETAATIERTQTVNLLRESMYRTCERYLSGAVSKSQFIVQAARDQRSMVAVLAVEQLTGAVRAKPTIISGPATSASIIDGDKVAELVTQYSQDQKSAKAAATSATAAFDAADKNVGCGANSTKPDAVDADKWAACIAAKATKEQRAADLKIADTRLDKILDLAGKATTQLSASTSAGTNQGDALVSNRPGDLAIIGVAQSIEKIVALTGVDEPLMFCIAFLQQESPREPQTLAQCLSILKVRAVSDEGLRGQVMSLQDPVAYQDHETLGRQALAAEASLLNLVRLTNPAKLQAEVERFETSIGIDLGLKSRCTARDACMAAIENADLAGAFSTKAKEISDALVAWKLR